MEKKLKTISEKELKDFANNLPLVDGSIGECFNCHGISKGSVQSQYVQLLSILENGIDPNRPFFTAPFTLKKENRFLDAAFGGLENGCIKSGLAVLVAPPFKPLREKIDFVFINDMVSFIIPKLSCRYPQYSFFKLSENKTVLTKIASVNKICSNLTYSPETFCKIIMERYKENMR